MYQRYKLILATNLATIDDLAGFSVQDFGLNLTGTCPASY